MTPQSEIVLVCQDLLDTWDHWENLGEINWWYDNEFGGLIEAIRKIVCQLKEASDVA